VAALSDEGAVEIKDTGMNAPGSQRPPVAVLVGVFVISGAVLALEIILTRLFAAVLAYHFSFLIISVAVCGLGLGGMLVARTVGTTRGRLAVAAAGFGLSSLFMVLAYLHLILPHLSDLVWLIAAPALVPFVCAGAFLALVFREHPARSGLIYACDLLGAAAAAPAVIVCMGMLGVMPSVVLVAVLAAAASFVVAQRRGPALAVVVATAALGMVGLALGWFEVPTLSGSSRSVVNPLFADLGPEAGHTIVLTEWDAFARTDVVRQQGVGDEALFIYTNGHVPSMMLRLIHGPDDSSYDAEANLASLPFMWRRPRSVLSIGPGGGLDIVLAKRFGAVQVDGVEVNPAIVRLMNGPRFREFSGDPYNWPGVRVSIGDGRTFVRRSTSSYDVIYMSLAKTTIRTLGLVLVEGYIYTVDAVGDYLDRLTDTGQLVVVTDDFRINARLLTTAAAALEECGIDRDRVVDHLAVVRIQDQLRGLDPYEYLLIVSRTPISRSAGAELERLAIGGGFVPELIPGRVENPPYGALRRAEAFTSEANQHWSQKRAESSPGTGTLPPLNLMPVTDDSPFFLDLSFGAPPILVHLTAASVGLIVLFSGWFLWARRGDGQGIRRPFVGLGEVCGLLYFSCLGVGFMLVEIAVIQKLILVLGHPTRAVTVALCALLVGGGVGSALSGRISDHGLARGLRLSCLAVSGLAVALALYAGAGHPTVLAWPLIGRILWAGLICGLAGVVMGIPFPTGVRSVGRVDPALIPWLWGVNGVSSVLGSVLAAIGAKLFGFQTVLVAGGLVYLLAMLVSQGFERANSEVDTDASRLTKNSVQ